MIRYPLSPGTFSLRNALATSPGQFPFSSLLGSELMRLSARFTSAWSNREKSVPFGKTFLSSTWLFSIFPFCPDIPGSQ